MSDALNEYQRAAARTLPAGEEPIFFKLQRGALGLVGESGEVVDLIKKHVYHGHPLDSDKLLKELGDVLWYVAALATALDVELSEVAAKNIAKLTARYPEGFSSEASMNRVDK